jgi:hypothetical protein
MNNPEVVQKIMAYLIFSQQVMKEVCGALISQRVKNLCQQPQFEDEIEKQFTQAVRELLSVELQKNVHCSPEDATIVLESLNIPQYLGTN